jgi:hypothetical protein
VEYERKSALPGPWGTKRGHLQLQPFGEALLLQGLGGHAMGITEQARLLFDRTAISGHVQLGDGTFAAPGVRADLTGRAEGRNIVRLNSDAVGRGVTVDLSSLSVRNATVGTQDMQLACDDAAGALVLRVFVDNAKLRFAFTIANLELSGLRLSSGLG